MVSAAVAAVKPPGGSNEQLPGHEHVAQQTGQAQHQGDLQQDADAGESMAGLVEAA